MKIYSPSQTKSYLESPLGWYLHYVEGWSPKAIGRKELSGFLGSAFAFGMDIWYKGCVEGPCTATLILDRSQRHLMKMLDEAYAAGYTVISREEPFLANLPEHLSRMLGKAIQHSPIPGDWTVLGSEVRIEEAGNCRVDLLVDTPQGVSFVDYKTKVTLEGYAKDRAITDWSQDWQFYHYAWALKEFNQTPVNAFHVALVIGNGTAKPSLHTFPLDEELLKLWEASARQIWGDMENIESGNRVPTWNFQMSNRYGADSWAEAIVSYKLHSNLMSRTYVRKVKRSQREGVID